MKATTDNILTAAAKMHPDFGSEEKPGRVLKMRREMTEAGVATGCTCKHHQIRKLLSGKSVKIGTSVFRAKKK